MNKKTIGIVGGGQLGRMLTEAAHKLGFKVLVLDPTLNSPAALVADEQIVADYKDKAKILELAEKSDFITVELEGVNEEALEEIEKSEKPVNPASKILKIIKDKFKQKEFLKGNSIPVADFAKVDNEANAKEIGKSFGYPFLLKSRFDAFDGRGNAVIKSQADISEAFKKLSKSSLYTEKFVPFVKELSVVSARDMFGKVIFYPVVETIHKNNICHIVRSPADIPKETQEKARELAERAINTLQGVGVFAIEMFLKENGEILVNEIAPRVHNSGHHTIEAFDASQFEEHIRAITGMHLVEPKAQSEAAVMVNILGERSGKAELKSAEKLDGAAVHIYGKIETRPERKMGHITVLGNTVKEAEEEALNIRKNISI